MRTLYDFVLFFQALAIENPHILRVMSGNILGLETGLKIWYDVFYMKKEWREAWQH